MKTYREIFVYWKKEKQKLILLLLMLSIISFFALPKISLAAYTSKYYNLAYPLAVVPPTMPSEATTPNLTRTDNEINFNWDTGSPDVSINTDGFAVRWTETKNFDAGTYYFSVSADDGVQAWIDSDPVFTGSWKDQGTTTYTATKTITAGSHTIKVEYYENGGGAVCQFSYYNQNPAVSSLVPADNATGISTTTNLVLNFNQTVYTNGTGSNDIAIKKASDNSTIETIDIQDAKVSGNGTTSITINPATALDEKTGYYVQIGANALRNGSGYYYPGISDSTTWSFTTGDFTNPTVSTLTPADNATGIAIDANLVIKFSENVDVESGNIKLYKSDDTLIETFALPSAKVTGTGTDTITINPTSNLDENTSYYLQIDATAFDDSAGNSYAGIDSSTSWNFTTKTYSITEGLLAHWKLDGNGNDSSGNGKNLTVTSSSYSDEYTNISSNTQSISLDGNDDKAVANGSLNGSSIPISESFWIRSSTPPATVPGWILALSNTGDNSVGYANGVYLDTSGHPLYYNWNGSSAILAQGTTNVTDGQWHNIITSFDGTHMKLFVDGNQEGGDIDFETTDTWNYIPVLAYIHTGYSRYQGLLDDVRIYNRALSAANIAEISDVDNTDPDISTSTPADNDISIAIDADLVINFTEAVNVGTGNIIIKKSSDNSTVETIDVTSSQVSVSDDTVTINPSANFEYNTGYYMQIDSAAFDDMAGNSFAGISDATTWNFTTRAPRLSGTPSFTNGTPAKFSTQLTVGAGTLNISTNLTYYWYRSDDDSFQKGDTQLGNGTTYTPVAADIGKYLIVNAFSDDAIGIVSVATASTVINAGNTASVNTSDGNASIVAPDGFASKNVTLNISKINTSSAPSAPSGFFMAGDNYFTLSATDDNGDPVIAFDQPVTFTISYGSDTELHYVESTLDVYKNNNGTWVKKNCTSNMNANTLTCSLSSFSDYGVLGEEITANSSVSDEDIEVKNVKYSSNEDSITIRWETNRKADSKVKYGTKKSNLDMKETDDKKEKKHKIVIKNLEPNTEYFFKAYSEKGDGNKDSSRIWSAKTSGIQQSNIKTEPETIDRTYSGDAKPNTCSYTVEEGDNLWTVAKKIYGDATAYPLIIEKNKEKYPQIEFGRLSIGQELNFDCKDDDSVSNVPDQSFVSQIASSPKPAEESKWWNPFSWF